MQRTLEPEVMDVAENAKAYADADFSEVNEALVERFLKLFPRFQRSAATLVDLGCGPADIPIRLARKTLGHIIGVDASDEMLVLAKKAVEKACLADRVRLVKARLPDLPISDRVDAILSNSLLHHIPDPAVFWKTISQIGHQGTAIYIMDLFRPESTKIAREVVESAAAKEHPLLKADFYNSLLAAFTIDEVRSQLSAAGFGRLSLEKTSDRHWLVSGSL